MKKFQVTLSSRATVGAVVEVEAMHGVKAICAALEKAKSGDVIWNYEGADDSELEWTDIQEIDDGTV